MDTQVLIFGIIIIFTSLFVAYVIGIVCIEYLKFPAPKYLNKKLAALLTGITVILITAFTIAELLGY